MVRVPGGGTATGETVPGLVPSRVQMLRNAILWSIHHAPPNFQARTAAIQWNGRLATCVLVSGMLRSDAAQEFDK